MAIAADAVGIPQPRPGAMCLVTGASSGLGVSLARLLAERGHDVLLVARRRDRLVKLAEELRGSGVRAEVFVCDLSQPDERRRLIERVSDGHIDVLVNNAGFGTAGRYIDASPDREREMIGVNVDTPVELCRAVAPAMVQRGAGAILNISSVAAFQPLPGMSLYAGTTAMLLAFSAGLHAELAPLGVTVTAMCPGAIRTEFAEVAGGSGVARRLPAAFWMSPDAVAAHGISGLERGRWLVVPGTINRVAGAFGRHVPRALILSAAKRLSAGGTPDA